MAFPLASARKWCNDSEYALVAASFGSKEIAWTAALLRSKIERSRKLRDKNRDKHREIRRANRATSGAKTGKQVTAMAVAEKRAKLFDETLTRYIAKLDKLNAAKRMKAMKAAVADALVRKRAAQAAAAGRGAAASRSTAVAFRLHLQRRPRPKAQRRVGPAASHFASAGSCSRRYAMHSSIRSSALA